jgi:metal-responsive CopG/Arc/MetJ family transcriptional regulator
MKTAISLPDPLFREAERMAKRLKQSRSQFYRRALEEFIARHDEDEIARAYEEVFGSMTSDEREEYEQLGAFVRRAGRALLRRVEW